MSTAGGRIMGQPSVKALRRRLSGKVADNSEVKQHTTGALTNGFVIRVVPCGMVRMTAGCVPRSTLLRQPRTQPNKGTPSLRGLPARSATGLNDQC
jgi:hypothetical protein